MSYLLEALKRLEEKRQGDSPSDLLITQTGAKRNPPSRPVWPYILSVALLINAGVAVWWLGVKRTATQTAATRPQEAVPSATHEPAVNVPANGPAEVPSTAADRLTPPPKGRAPSQTVVGEKARLAPVHAGTTTADSPSPVPRRPARTETATPAEVTAARTVAPAAPKTPETAQGPAPANERSVPAKSDPSELKVSLHSYSSDPSSRLVRINDRTLKEGDSLDGGVKVEEITPDGVVVSQEGRRFRLGVKQDR